MESKTIEKVDMDKLRKVFRLKSRAQAEMQMVISELEDKYDFSIEIDKLDIANGVINYGNSTQESNNAN